MMELLKRNEQLEDVKAQLEGRLSMLEREEMVQIHTLDSDIAGMHYRQWLSQALDRSRRR